MRLTLTALEELKVGNESLSGCSPDFVSAAEHVWQQLMDNPDCRKRGQFMLDHMSEKPIQVFVDWKAYGPPCELVNLRGMPLICPV